MKNTYLLKLMLLLVFPFSSYAQQAFVPVFESGKEGYKSFRIPAIISLPNGELIAFAEGRVDNSRDFGNIDIVMKRSSDKGKTWTGFQQVVDFDAMQVGNPAPVVDMDDPMYPKGRIFLFYNTGNNHEAEIRKAVGYKQIWYKTSTDGGITWSAPVDITSQVHRIKQPQVNPEWNFAEDWRYYANTPGHALQIPSGKYKGRIYVAANHSAGPPKPKAEDYHAHGFYSDDHGKTFKISDPVSFAGSNESMAAALGGDKLMMNSRNQQGDVRQRIISISSDGGQTWDTTYYDKNLPDPVNQGSIISFKNKKGKLILASCNAADQQYRDNLTLRISDDEGKTWLKHILLLLLLFNFRSLAQDITRPALIPLPELVQWTGEVYDLKNYQAILAGEELQKSALNLQKYLEGKGLKIPVIQQAKDNGVYIRLELENNSKTPEAYALDVNSKGITIKGASHAGLFYGVQTFKQLTSSTNKIYGCHITDQPAFAWRGYMIDVGRNFMPMDMLKQQIDVMARYKLNIFHFHFTEDIAWRLQSKLYPQLTSPETMLRNKGSYYTEADLKELINYCKERYITLIPEIDMPGHSAAFKRAMKVDMQSDSGLAIVKNIIREFCSTYDVPYLHIGADEVKITNKNFLPEVTSLIESLGKQVIGWEPGGNFTESTLRQLWMEGATKVSANKNIKYIDSRHLYLNHMDPLESVVTIFNRQICNLTEGNPSALGGIICTWPDRRVDKPEDVLLQNPVYPAMLAFAERSWKGGGKSGWTASIGAPGSVEAAAFSEFENRLMHHKDLYFAKLPFPYVRQTGMKWKLYGPFKNEGNLTQTFAPQNKNFDFKKEPVNLNATGGTLVLRHWWAPEVRGVLNQPQENTTWYATTEIWSNKEETRGFWIGFNNISRSYASDSPKAGTWDNRNSQVYVNGQLIAAPNWKQAGQKGDLEKPLVDEGYEYREPTKIKLKKGWNKVLIKLPVGSFKGIDWKNPEKWMFTFVLAPKSH